MIKAAIHEEQNKVPAFEGDKIDALAAALGFTFDGAAYVRTGRKTVRRISRQSSYRASLASSANLPRIPKSMYSAMRAMQVGEALNVTAYVRHMDLQRLQRRLYSWRWNEAERFGRTARFQARASSGGGKVVVRLS